MLDGRCDAVVECDRGYALAIGAQHGVGERRPPVPRSATRLSCERRASGVTSPWSDPGATPG